MTEGSDKRGWSKIEVLHLSMVIIIAIIAAATLWIAHDTDIATKNMVNTAQDMEKTLRVIANYTRSLYGPELAKAADCKLLTRDTVNKLNFSLNDSDVYYADIFYVTPIDAPANNLKIEIRIPYKGFEYIGIERTKIFSDGVGEAIPFVDKVPVNNPENMAISYTWEKTVSSDNVKALVILYTGNGEQLQDAKRHYKYTVQGITKVEGDWVCSGLPNTFTGFRHKNDMWD